MNFHPTDRRALLIDGHLVLPGTFYNPPVSRRPLPAITAEVEQTDPAPPATPPVPPPPPDNDGAGGQQTGIPEYDNITVEAMKSMLDLWEVDYSGQTKDKATLYAFFVEEAKQRNGNAE